MFILISSPSFANRIATYSSKGLTAAGTALSERFGQRRIRPDAGDASFSDGGNLDLGDEAKRWSAQSRHRENEDKLKYDPVDTSETEAEPYTAPQGHPKMVGGDFEAWIKALEVPLEYVDYATVARERVSATRRRRGSDLKRGPACPVCNG